MDFGELNDMLDDDTSYVPTFNKVPRTTPKPLIKQSSTKSIETPNILNPNYSQKKNTLFQIHKESRKQSISFQQFFKEQEQFEKPQKLIIKENPNRTEEYRPQVDEEEPVRAQRNMKPPLSKKTQQNKSIASFDRKTLNNDSNFINTKKIEKDFDGMSPLALLQKDDEKEIKKMIDQQLQFQRTAIEKVLTEERESHRSQKDRMKQNYEEQIRKRIELKDLQISKIKEFYEMQLKIKAEKIDDTLNWNTASKKIDENLRLLEKMETEMRVNNMKQEEQKKQQYQAMSARVDQELKRRERQVQSMFQKLTEQQQQFRQDKMRTLSEIQIQRNRLHEQELKVTKAEAELEGSYRKKQKDLNLQIDSHNHKIEEQKSQLRMEKMQIQQEQLQLTHSKEELSLHKTKFQEQRKATMEELHLQKTKLISKEIQISTRLNSILLQESEIENVQKDLSNRLKLLELEKKKVGIERGSSQKYQNLEGSYSGWSLASHPKKQEGEASSYEKSIKQMRDQYLRSLSQL